MRERSSDFLKDLPRVLSEEMSPSDILNVQWNDGENVEEFWLKAIEAYEALEWAYTAPEVKDQRTILDGALAAVLSEPKLAQMSVIDIARHSINAPLPVRFERATIERAKSLFDLFRKFRSLQATIETGTRDGGAGVNVRAGNLETELEQLGRRSDFAKDVEPLLAEIRELRKVRIGTPASGWGLAAAFDQLASEIRELGADLAGALQRLRDDDVRSLDKRIEQLATEATAIAQLLRPIAERRGELEERLERKIAPFRQRAAQMTERLNNVRKRIATFRDSVRSNANPLRPEASEADWQKGVNFNNVAIDIRIDLDKVEANLHRRTEPSESLLRAIETKLADLERALP